MYQISKVLFHLSNIAIHARLKPSFHAFNPPAYFVWRGEGEKTGSKGFKPRVPL